MLKECTKILTDNDRGFLPLENLLGTRMATLYSVAKLVLSTTKVMFSNSMTVVIRKTLNQNTAQSVFGKPKMKFSPLVE